MEDDEQHYRMLVNALIDVLEAEAVVLIVLNGKHGSGGCIAARNEDVILAIPDAIEQVLKRVRAKIKQSGN